MLLLFIASYGLVLLKDFVFSGTYKALWSKTWFSRLMHAFCAAVLRYTRRYVPWLWRRQSIRTHFVVVKLWFENLLDYNKMIKAPVTTAPCKIN